VTLADRLKQIEKDTTLDKKEKLAARLKLLDSFVDVCNAIAFAHSKGVIHRDLKPENVMIGEYGETVVLDWGLARVRGQEDVVRDQLVASTRILSRSIVEGDSEKLTMDGSIVGTPAYMAPEQARGELDELDEQTDVYALGAVLYEILGGRPPFTGPVPAIIIQQVIHGKPARLSATGSAVPPELEALVEHAMAKDKSDRLGSAREMASEIKAFRDGRTLSSYQYTARELVARWVHRNKKAVLAGFLVAYVLLAGAVWHYFSLRGERDVVEAERRAADEKAREAELSAGEARVAGEKYQQEKIRAEHDRLAAERATVKAQEAEAAAKQESDARTLALAGWDRTLADAYAMRVRLAMTERDYNAAVAFAGAALKAAEQPEARGALMAWPQVYPLLWHMPAAAHARAELYEFYSVIHSPDARHVASSMPDGRILIFDVATGQLAQELRIGSKPVYAIAFHPAGEWLAAADADGRVVVFARDPATGRVKDNSEQLADYPDYVGSVAFSPDGETLAVSAGRVHLFQVAGWKPVGEMEGQPSKSPSFLSFSPDGRTILTASPLFEDLFVRAWDVPTRKLRTTLLDMDAMNEVFTAWSPDGSVVACSTLQGQIRLRDGKSLRLIHTLHGHTSVVMAVTFTPDGSQLVSTSADGTLRVWDVNRREQVAVLSGFESWLTSVSVSPDGGDFCARAVDGGVRVWAMPDHGSRAMRGHSSDVLDVRFSGDGARFVTAGWDGKVALWDAVKRDPIREFSVPLRQFFAADFLPGDRVLGAGSDGVRVWDAKTGAEVEHIRPGEIVTDLAVARDGSFFAFTHYRQVYVYDAQSYEQRAELGRLAQMVLGCAISPDGSLVAVTCNDGTVTLFNVSERKRVTQVSHGGGPVYGVAFSPDGTRIASVGEDRHVRTWGVPDGAPLSALQGHDGIAFTVRYSPDGRYLFTSSQDRSIRVWDAGSGEAVAVLKGHSETVSRLSVSPDGMTLLSGSQDDTIRTWPLAALTEPRDALHGRVEALTGLTVEDKEFRASMLADWPGAGVHPELRDLRSRRQGEIGSHARAREGSFEGYRYEDSATPDGRAVRRYFAPRPVVAGTPQGAAMGRVNYAAWWADRHPQWLEWRKQRAPRITEVSGGQAKEQGLRAGDILWRIDGERVTDRDALRAKLDLLSGNEFMATIRRYALDAQGNFRAQRAEDGSLLLDQEGNPQWAMEEFTVKFAAGPLGMRAENAAIDPHPWR
jgi:WD40 repeat protein